MQDDIKRLREAVGKDEHVTENTVVRYMVRDLTYVAIYVGGFWWTSSSYETKLSYADFMEVLRRASTIEVAADWAAL